MKVTSNNSLSQDDIDTSFNENNLILNNVNTSNQFFEHFAKLNAVANKIAAVFSKREFNNLDELISKLISMDINFNGKIQHIEFVSKKVSPDLLVDENNTYIKLIPKNVDFDFIIDIYTYAGSGVYNVLCIYNTQLPTAGKFKVVINAVKEIPTENHNF